MNSPSTTSAFVSTLPLSHSASTFLPKSSLSPRTPSHSISHAFTTSMALETKDKPKVSSFSRLEENRKAKLDSEYRGPQGFTPYAERVNGRLAMMGFFIGLVTEAVSGKPIGEQMLIMFGPLTNLLAALFHTTGV